MIREAWQNIPDELRYSPKWCIAAPDKSPYTTGGSRASVTNPSNWSDWYSSAMTAGQWGNGSGIGFVLSDDDCFTCIDLDVKPDTTQERLDRFWKIVQAFDSYTERSTSGKGLHIWVKGKVGTGCRRDGIEVYSQQRFIICTGDVLPGYHKPVEDRQEMLDLLVAEIRNAAQTTATELVEQEEAISDEELWSKAADAANGDKFRSLWNATSCVGAGERKSDGSYTELGYPSQSEADLSLLSILCFYSRSNEQVRRLFRLSGLGQRDKAQKNDRYLNATLKIIRGRQKREDAAAAAAQETAIKLVETSTPQKLLPVAVESSLEWPPGVVGRLAQWFYAIAPRPVKEVALISALGVVAGLYGRAYNISNSGLNLYMVLVGRSATGKEAMHSSISKLSHVLMSAGAAKFSEFVNFNDYASGPALVKAVSNSEMGSFVNVAGEWGRKLRKMGDDHTEGPMSSLRTVMTNLYQKSSAGTIVGGIGYSDKEKNVASVNGVAYSMIGETTPDTFYESLTNTMMQDGFMSRFIVIEYTGNRPKLNTATSAKIPEEIYNTLLNGFGMVMACPPGSYKDVALSREAQDLMDEFDEQCNHEIDSTDDESWRQMWNRAHLKSLKVSGLLAVADCPASPIVTKGHAEWALGLIKKDIAIMRRKMASGDVGDGDIARERKMISVLAEYLQNPAADGYKLCDDMRKQGVIPRKYLQIRLQRVNSFAKHRLGQTLALDQTLRSLCDSGYIVEVAKDKIPTEWNFHGKAYRIVSLPDVI